MNISLGDPLKPSPGCCCRFWCTSSDIALKFFQIKMKDDMSIFTTFESVILKIKREWKYFVGGGVYLILENLGGAGGKEGEMLSFQVKDRKRGYWDTYKLKIWIREGNEDLSLSWKLCTNSATPSHQVICCHWFFKFAIPAEVVVIFKLSILLRHWACLGVLVLFPSCDHFSFSSKKGPNTSILFWWLSHHHSFGYECFCLSV